MVDDSNPILSVILNVLIIVWVLGIPFFVASLPGLIAWAYQRKILGSLIIVGALCALVIPRRLETERLLAQGIVADSLDFLILPLKYAIPYAVIATLFTTVFMLLVKRRRD